MDTKNVKNTDEKDVLVAFRFEAPPAAACVSVVGSWDNFKRPYPMTRDSRGSRAIWRRYSNFTEVVCDGDQLRRIEDARNGCLRMGGTYWYYFQIDNEWECCDKHMPKTRSCPLLPGQEVNILEVPSETRPSNISNESTTSLEVHTLDPDAKYNMFPEQRTLHNLDQTDRPSSLAACAALQQCSSSSSQIRTASDSEFGSCGLRSFAAKSKMATLFRLNPFKEHHPGPSGLLSPNIRPSTAPSFFRSRTQSNNVNRKISSHFTSSELLPRLHTSPDICKLRRPETRRRGSNILNISDNSSSVGISVAASPIEHMPVRNDALSAMIQGFFGHIDEQNLKPPALPLGSDLSAGHTNRREVPIRTNPTRTTSSSSRDAPLENSQIRSDRLGYHSQCNASSVGSSNILQAYDPTNIPSEATQSSLSATEPSGSPTFPTGLTYTEAHKHYSGIYRAQDNVSGLTIHNVKLLHDSLEAMPLVLDTTGSQRSKRVEEWNSQVTASDLDAICTEMSYLGSMIT